MRDSRRVIDARVQGLVLLNWGTKAAREKGPQPFRIHHPTRPNFTGKDRVFACARVRERRVHLEPTLKTGHYLCLPLPSSPQPVPPPSLRLTTLLERSKKTRRGKALKGAKRSVYRQEQKFDVKFFIF